MDDKRDLKKAQSKVCKKAATIANKKMREEFFDQSAVESPTWASKIAALSKPHSLIMKFAWNPFRGNHRVPSGLSLELSKVDEGTIRQSLAEQAESRDKTMRGLISSRPGRNAPKKLDVKKEVDAKMGEIVTNSITEAIMKDPKDFITALVQDTLTNADPFYKE